MMVLRLPKLRFKATRTKNEPRKQKVSGKVRENNTLHPIGYARFRLIQQLCYCRDGNDVFLSFPVFFLSHLFPFPLLVTASSVRCLMCAAATCSLIRCILFPNAPTTRRPGESPSSGELESNGRRHSTEILRQSA